MSLREPTGFARFVFLLIIIGSPPPRAFAAEEADSVESEEEEEEEEEDNLDTDELAYETVVVGERPPRDATKREITAEQIGRIPGTYGDALLALQNLPGVARMPMMSGMLFVRGSEPEDSAYFIDSMFVPSLYHFGGVNAIINSDLLETIEFYPGNFPVRYGRATGGVINARTRAPRSDRFHGYIDTDIWDTTVLAEGPISENWSVAASVRRSYIDLILDNIDAIQDYLQYSVAPRYYDFQLLMDYHPDSSDNLDIMFYGSDDKIAITGFEEVGNLEVTSLNTHAYSYRAQIDWSHRFTSEFSNQLTCGVGYFGGRQKISDDEIGWHVFPLHLRDELSIVPSKHFALRLGTDSGLGWKTIEFQEIDYSGETLTRERRTRFELYPAVYAELELNAVENLQMIYGLRLDYARSIDTWSVDPRVSARYSPFELTTFKAAFGLFQKPVDMFVLEIDEYQSGVLLESAIQYSVGVEQALWGFEQLKVDIEGFYKDFRHMRALTTFEGDGQGRAYGLEMKLDLDLTDRFFGWVAYTLMKTEYRSYPGADPRPLEFDQTHILSVVAAVELGRGFDAGLRFRLASGNTYQPIVGSHYDADAGMYWPLDGEPASARYPMFHQLDVRVGKRFDLSPLSLYVYLDVQNVYLRRNVLSYTYRDDYQQKIPITELPFLPSLGLRLEY